MNSDLLLPLIAVGLSIILWLVISWASGRNIVNIDQFYKRNLTSSYLKNTPIFFSFVASNIVIGGVIFTFISAGATYGVFFVPLIAVYLIANILFYKFIKNFIYSITVPVDKPLIQHFSDKITECRKEKCTLEIILPATIALYYIVLFSFEIFVTSDFLVKCFFNGEDKYFWLLSSVLVATSMLCVYLGGIRGVLLSDKFQFWFILLFIFAITYSALSTSGSFNSLGSFELNIKSIIMLSLFSLNILASPYINFNNIYLAENTSKDKVKSIMYFPHFRGAILMSFTVVLLVFIGIATSGDSVVVLIQKAFLEVPIISWALIFATTAILLSSTDSLMLTALYNLYSTSVFSAFIDKISASVLKARLMSNKFLVFAVYLIPYIVIAGLYQNKPDIFGFIVASSSAVIVFSPLIILLAALNNNNEISKITNKIIYTFTIFFVVAILSAVVVKQPLATYLNAILLIFSFVYAMTIFFKRTKDRSK